MILGCYGRLFTKQTAKTEDRGEGSGDGEPLRHHQILMELVEVEKGEKKTEARRRWKRAIKHALLTVKINNLEKKRLAEKALFLNGGRVLGQSGTEAKEEGQCGETKDEVAAPAVHHHIKHWQPSDRLHERLHSMPTWKRWLSILFFCCLWLAYLAFGGYVFNIMEGDAEFVREERYKTWGDSICALQQEEGASLAEKARLQSLLENADPDPAMRTKMQQERLRKRLEAQAAAQARNSTNSTNTRRMLEEEAEYAPEEEADSGDAEDLEQWTLFGATWFSWTLCTSIGYGSYAPNSMSGQWAVILYGFVGIAILGRTNEKLAELWAPPLHNAMTDGYQRVFGKGARCTAAAGPIITVLVIVVVMLIGGALFEVLQEADDSPYTYEESFYFFFVTLSTIGLGDYVPSSKLALVVIGVYLFFGMDKFGALVDLIVKLLDRLLIFLNSTYNNVCCLHCLGTKARSPLCTILNIGIKINCVDIHCFGSFVIDCVFRSFGRVVGRLVRVLIGRPIIGRDGVRPLRAYLLVIIKPWS